jgi:hypothetical protein
MFLEVIRVAWLNVLGQVVEVLPGLIAALVILILGLVIGPIVGGLVARLVRAIKIDKFSEKSGIKDALGAFGDVSLAILLGKLVKWFIIVISLVAAADILGWNQITAVLETILFYIPNVIIAVVILAAGILVGGVIESFVKKAAHGVDHAALIAKTSRLSVVAFASLAALIQLGVAPSLIEILFAGIVLALALAFGLGGRAKAAEALDRIF